MQYGNDAIGDLALGVDVGSTNAKVVLIEMRGESSGGAVRELIEAHRALPHGAARVLVATVRGLVAQVLSDASDRGLPPVRHIGITSMAESGALVGPDSTPTGELLRWDSRNFVVVPPGMDPVALHEHTGAPVTSKLPLLRWAQLCDEGVPRGARWGFVSDLVAADLTGRLATDHTLAGRSGACALPPPGRRVTSDWDADMLACAGVPVDLPPDILVPGEPVGVISTPMRGAAADALVWIAGHDHAVAAWMAGLHHGGVVVHSAGTTEAVLSLGDPGHPIDRRRAGAEGMSVVRTVDGAQEGVLAGSSAGGSMIAAWRKELEGSEHNADRILRRVDEVSGGWAEALTLPYPSGRRCPAPDPAAVPARRGSAREPEAELRGILRGLAAHGAWMRAEVESATTPARIVRIVGGPMRRSRRLAGLVASLSTVPLDLVDLASPAATGAAALAAVRAGAIDRAVPPMRAIAPDDDGVAGLMESFHSLVRATSKHPRGTS